MKTSYLVGGLSVIGVIALLIWHKKPRGNSEGFYSATGDCGCGAK